jgi:8-oxo-dGTP diphosphatase
LKGFTRKDSKGFNANTRRPLISKKSYIENSLKNIFMKKRAPQGFLMSFVLFCIALLLVMITAPFGFVYALIRQTCSSKSQSLNIYFIEVALVLDEVGNVTMQHLLNDILLIRKENTYFFGNKNETISSVIGKNSLTNTLSPLGRVLNSFLNFLDKDHSLNSIIYDIKIWKENNL